MALKQTRRRRQNGTFVAVIGLALGLTAAPVPLPASEAADRQEVTFRFLEKKPATATAARFRVAFRDPRNPAAKPPSVARQVSRLPRGTVQLAAGERCTASDAELMLLGESACPRRSFLFPGAVLADNGPGAPIPRYTRFRTYMFDNGSEMVSLLEIVDPATQPPARFVSRSQIRGRVMITKFPAFVTDPFGESSYSAMRRVTASPPPPGVALRLVTPRSCPRRGHWTAQFRFTYRDGVSEKERVRMPCHGGRR